MAKQLHPVKLTTDERRQLEGLTRRGVASARRLRRARMLLLSADGLPDPAVAAERLGALDERPHPGAAPKLDGSATATLVGLACTAPPPGRAKWNMQLLADKLVGLGAVGAASDETVRRTLKKTSSSPGSGSSGVWPS